MHQVELAHGDATRELTPHGAVELHVGGVRERVQEWPVHVPVAAGQAGRQPIPGRQRRRLADKRRRRKVGDLLESGAVALVGDYCQIDCARECAGVVEALERYRSHLRVALLNYQQDPQARAVPRTRLALSRHAQPTKEDGKGTPRPTTIRVASTAATAATKNSVASASCLMLLSPCLRKPH